MFLLFFRKILDTGWDLWQNLSEINRNSTNGGPYDKSRLAYR